MTGAESWSTGINSTEQKRGADLIVVDCYGRVLKESKINEGEEQSIEIKIVQIKFREEKTRVEQSRITC